MITLGLDVGSNSVGSAWVDTDRRNIHLAASVFPAGVDEREDKRGAPKNQARRQTRSQRRNIDRRSRRKRNLRRFLTDQGFLPRDSEELENLFDVEPWHLRRKALTERLSAFEFGRVLVHLAQRRGAVGVVLESEEEDEDDEKRNEGKKVKSGMDRLEGAMKESSAETVGQFIADRIDQLHRPIDRAPDEQCSRSTIRTRRKRAEAWKQRGETAPEPHYNEAVRNRQYRISEDQHFYAGRDLIQKEFHLIVKSQRSFQDAPLASMLTDELIIQLDQPAQSGTWRHKGLLFGQRRTYWDTGTLGRCVLEPTERCVPKADRHASYFRVIETVNNIRIQRHGEDDEPLSAEQRNKVICLLRAPLGLHTKGAHAGKPKTSVSVTEIKDLLGIKPRDKHVKLNIEADKDREINTDWFHREIVHGAFTEPRWDTMSEPQRESVSRAILKLNPDQTDDAEKLRTGAMKWWGLDADAADRLLEAWMKRPKLEARLNLSRRAILNLLEHMNRFDVDSNRWPTEQEARKAYAKVISDRLEGPPTLVGRSPTAETAIHLNANLERLMKEAGIGKQGRKSFRKRFACDSPSDLPSWWSNQLREYQMQREWEQNQNRARDTGENTHRFVAARYATAAAGLSAADRYYMRLRKHQIKLNGEVVRDADGKPLAVLPPAPMLSNPVVRKAIHEVRRHLLAYLHKFRRTPDRVVIEFVRGVTDTTKRRNQQLSSNRKREAERKSIEKYLRDWGIAESNWKQATLRVRLCREQNGICPFSLEGPNANRTITEKMAAEGREVEVEHIVPVGLGGKTMNFHHLVLCFREANRGKGMRTPIDWLGADKLKLMLERLEKAPIRENQFKWERLQTATPNEEDFRNSQLTDTAYAARQVAAYIADALFGGKGLPERGGDRKIFTTKGEFTARLRADWGLQESTIDRDHGLEAPPSVEQLRLDPHLEQSTRRARKEPKDRTDHRHHAIDAVVIALVGPELLTDLGRMAREDREYRERTGHWPHRTPIDPPQGFTFASFRQQVLAGLFGEKPATNPSTSVDSTTARVVSHRPVKRRLVGKFHEETHYGPVIEPLCRHRTEKIATLYTNRIAIIGLKPNHLRVPDRWDELSANLDNPSLPTNELQRIRQELAALDDLSPGKPGIVRDRSLRDRLRKCLRTNGLDPDKFTDKEIRKLVDENKLTMASGIPIKGVVLLRTIAEPVIIARKRFDSKTAQMVPDVDAQSGEPNPRTKRVYIGGNNHHLEIREIERKRKGKVVSEWIGAVITTFVAARRNRARLDALRKAGVPSSAKLRRMSKEERLRFSAIVSEIDQQHPVVDRRDMDNGRFVMSLAEGEMILARRWDTKIKHAIGDPEFFVVCKLDKEGNSFSVHFAPHWDARKASEQDRWEVTPANLKACGPSPGIPPQKVRVGPLGEVKTIRD